MNCNSRSLLKHVNEVCVKTRILLAADNPATLHDYFDLNKCEKRLHFSPNPCQFMDSWDAQNSSTTRPTEPIRLLPGSHIQVVNLFLTAVIQLAFHILRYQTVLGYRALFILTCEDDSEHMWGPAETHSRNGIQGQIFSVTCK